jgi:hypothetical protein
LIYLNQSLYESTGLEGHSSIRRVELETGKVLQKREVPAPYFAEGLTSWHCRLIQLTWLSQVGFVYDRLTLNPTDQFHYSWQGWGLTHDRRQLIASDGSDTLRFLDPVTYSVTRELNVTDGGEPVRNLNESDRVHFSVHLRNVISSRQTEADVMSFLGMSRSIIRCAVFCSGDDSSFGFAPGTHRLMSLRPAIPWWGALLHCPPPLYQPTSILNRLVGTVNHHLTRAGEFSTGDMGNFQPELTQVRALRWLPGVYAAPRTRLDEDQKELAT